MKQIIFIFFLFVCSVITVHACSVAPGDHHPRNFREAKAIFIGKVIDVSVDDRQITGTRRYNILYKIRFSVEKRWKGQSSEITVVSDNGEFECGIFKFEAGKKYLVYADDFEGRLFTWATSGSPSRPYNPEDAFVKWRLKQLNSFWYRWKARLHFQSRISEFSVSKTTPFEIHLKSMIDFYSISM